MIILEYEPIFLSRCFQEVLTTFSNGSLGIQQSLGWLNHYCQSAFDLWLASEHKFQIWQEDGFAKIPIKPMCEQIQLYMKSLFYQ